MCFVVHTPRARPDLRQLQQVLPYLRIVDRLGHEVGSLLFSVHVLHTHSRVGTHLEEPLEIDPVGTWQVAKCHAARLCYQLNNRLVVFGNDQAGRLLRATTVREVLSWIEPF